MFCKKYGKGFVYKIDETEKDWFYDFHFADGTRIWMSQADGERYVKHRKKVAPTAE